MPGRGRRLRRALQFITCAISLFLLLFGFLSWKIGRATHTMIITARNDGVLAHALAGSQSILSSLAPGKRAPLRGESDGRTNILLLGKANDHTAGQKLTDTIMVLSLDFEHKRVAVLSLPRDLYVHLPDHGLSTKLNALYQYDIRDETAASTVRSAVSDITGLPIHYFAAIDYDGFVHIIDALGGISVYVERDLFDPNFPGPNYSYETFEIKKGWRDLDGRTALKYVRERHADPDGDFGRAKRQHDVVAAIRDKALSLKILLTPLAVSDMIDAVGNHVRTDLSSENLSSLTGIAKEFDTKNIKTAVVDAWKKESLLRVSHVPVGSVSMFILVPRTGDWSETRELAHNLFDLEKIHAQKEAIALEAASIGIRNESGFPTLGKRLQTLLTEDFGIREARLLPQDERAVIRKESVLLDTGQGQAIHTLDQLAKTLSLRREKRDPDVDNGKDDGYDIVIILGEDMGKRLSFEEDAPEKIHESENDLEYQKTIDQALGSDPKI